MPPKKTGSGRKRKVNDSDSEQTSGRSSKRAKKSAVTSKKDAPIAPTKPTEKADESHKNKDKSLSKPAASDVNGNATAESRPFCYWLFKSEPESRFEKGIDMKFGFDDLKAEPDQTACWDGVRNYQARNFMKDQMRVGDRAFFYHSNAKPSGVVGLIHVVKESYVDHTQFDRKDPHFDPKASKDNPRWFMVDVKYDRPLKRFIPLHELKALHEKHKKSGGPLKDLALFTKARLSVQPMTKEEFDFIVDLENEEDP